MIEIIIYVLLGGSGVGFSAYKLWEKYTEDSKNNSYEKMLLQLNQGKYSGIEDDIT